MSLMKTAEELLKLADEIDKAASEAATFVCSKCNHTASMAMINSKRKASAEEAKKTGQNITVSDITVNDKIACPACEGTMEYRPTQASDMFFYKEADEKPEEEKEPEEVSPKPEEKPEEVEKPSIEPEKKEASEAIDYDSLKRYSA